MKRGFKAFAVLAAIAVASAGPQLFAVCGEFGGYAIFQCAEEAYFDAPPAGAGAVSAAFWQVGYGNATLNTGNPPTSNGSGMSGLTTFNGNDNGNFALDLVDAQTTIGNAAVPAGALCLRNNNWGNAGIDGCCDNHRDPAQLIGDDDILNPEYNVYYSRAFGYPGYASLDWVQDYPMGVLLTESSGQYFAVAAVATTARTGPTDVRVGDYNFKNISNGAPNAVTGANNVIPWQAIPGGAPFVVNVNEDPITFDRTLDLQWSGAAVHTDASNRPSTNPTVAGGVGVAAVGTLLRYVVETQGIVNPADPVGSLNPAGWTAVTTTGGTTAQIVVPPDTCVRLSTFLGRDPQTLTPTIPTCRLGQCGDLGIVVSGPAACVGGPLVADGAIKNGKAIRGKGIITLSFDTNAELSVKGFEISAIKKNQKVKIADLSCTECTTGLGATYEMTLSAGQLKGARKLEVKAKGPNTSAVVAVE